MEILQTLIEGLKPGINDGELVGLIEQGQCNQHLAWLTVFRGLATDYTQHQSSQSPLIVIENNQRLVILSDNTLKLNPSQIIMGREGKFHLPNIFQVPQEYVHSSCSPEEVYFGEYDIKRAFERFPELAVYVRLFD